MISFTVHCINCHLTGVPLYMKSVSDTLDISIQWHYISMHWIKSVASCQLLAFDFTYSIANRYSIRPFAQNCPRFASFTPCRFTFLNKRGTVAWKTVSPKDGWVNTVTNINNCDCCQQVINLAQALRLNWRQWMTMVSSPSHVTVHYILVRNNKHINCTVRARSASTPHKIYLVLTDIISTRLFAASSIKILSVWAAKLSQVLETKENP